MVTECSGSVADNVDLGTACGKLHRVCTLAITDPGEQLFCIQVRKVNSYSRLCCNWH